MCVYVCGCLSNCKMKSRDVAYSTHCFLLIALALSCLTFPSLSLMTLAFFFLQSGIIIGKLLTKKKKRDAKLKRKQEKEKKIAKKEAKKEV